MSPVDYLFVIFGIPPLSGLNGCLKAAYNKEYNKYKISIKNPRGGKDI